MKKMWTIGTRGSRLALKQAEIVINLLQKNNPGHIFSIKKIKTTGDNVWDKPLHLIGGKGLFVKEIEEELLSGSIDFAVHSMKDMPTEIDPHLKIGAILTREDPRDVFISTKYDSMSSIPDGGRLGTNSLRRQSQVLSVMRNINIIPIRGNVDTRIRKIETENLDGIILAYAGVMRMGFSDKIKEIIPLHMMVPPSGQGAIGVETRNQGDLLSVLESINDEVSFREVTIERKLQMNIGGGCNVPLGINASIDKQILTLHVILGKENGEILVRDIQKGDVKDSEAMIHNAVMKLDKYR